LERPRPFVFSGLSRFCTNLSKVSRLARPKKARRASRCFRLGLTGFAALADKFQSGRNFLPSPKDKKMHELERRYRERFDIRVPFEIRNMDLPGLPAQSAESSDISARGLYFATDSPLPVGTRIEMFIRMPSQISGELSPQWRCTGRVVRAQAAESDATRGGNGVEIQCYEVMGVAATPGLIRPRREKSSLH
jgi:hypothetical protein